MYYSSTSVAVIMERLVYLVPFLVGLVSGLNDWDDPFGKSANCFYSYF